MSTPTRHNPGMKKKNQFMSAVEILAPGDHFIHQVAQRIPVEELPNFPGAAALEFVVAVQQLREPLNAIEFQAPTDQDRSDSHQPTTIKNHLSIPHAVRIQSAKCWLELGQADEALRELEALPMKAWNHPLAVEARVAAIGALNERNQANQVSQVTVQE
jgi:hypothetical protein